MLSSVLDFEGLRASNTLLRTKLSFKIIFLIFIFFLFTFGVLLVDFNTIYSVLLLVFLVTKSISVYYQLPWFEMKKRYYIFVKFTVISFTTVNTQSIVSPSDFICFKEKIITQENLDIKNTMGVAQYGKAQPVCWIKTVRQIKELCRWDFFCLSYSMSQRGNDHSLLTETNESTFFLSLLFSMQTDCCISRGEKSKCGSPYQP